MDEQAVNGEAHVLVVDDHRDQCEALARLLRVHGLSTACAVGGAAALEHLAGRTPDLILLDLMMPGMDGREVLRRIRSDPRTADVPVVVFSAMPEPDGRERAMRAGATDYWVKAGVDYKDLCQRVSAYLGR
jgi:CheY-like chemotaxis protein